MTLLPTPVDLWKRAIALGQACRKNGRTALSLDLLVVQATHGVCTRRWVLQRMQIYLSDPKRQRLDASMSAFEALPLARDGALLAGRFRRQSGRSHLGHTQPASFPDAGQRADALCKKGLSLLKRRSVSRGLEACAASSKECWVPWTTNMRSQRGRYWL